MIQGAISLVLAIGVTITALNVPAKWFSVSQWLSDPLGAFTLTDILSTDLLSDYPTVQNNNNTTLENVITSIIGTTTNSTITTLSGLTTASGLVTVGTITTGTWSAGTIAINKGGTNATGFPLNGILSFDGTSIFATSSQPLHIGYLNATSTATSTLTGGLSLTRLLSTATSSFAGIAIDTGGVAIKTIVSCTGGLQTNSSGDVICGTTVPTVFVAGSGQTTATGLTSTTTLSTATIPASTIDGAGDSIRVIAYGEVTAPNSQGCHFQIRFGNGTSSTTVAYSLQENAVESQLAVMNLTITATSSAGQVSFSSGIGSIAALPSLTDGSTEFESFTAPYHFYLAKNNLAVNLAAKSYLSFDARAMTSSQCRFIGYTVEAARN